MLSVLIPTYNFNAFFLVKEIHQQLILENIDFEILCIDDASESKLNIENEKINTFSNTTFKVLNSNIGRSAIRNLLAKEANYPWLLFLDVDVFPADTNFIKKYIVRFKENNNVFCGGLLYEDKKQNLTLLRYKYGKKHEEIPLKVRQLNSEKYFFTSNFLIEKQVFNEVKFEEKLKKYGREDLLFSLNLIKRGYKIKHISNEVYHLGLEENSFFVAKTKKAMENLILLEEEQLIEENEVILLSFIKKIERLKMIKIIGRFHTFFEKLAINQSSVFYLNCMKVCYLCHLKSNYE